MEYAFGLIALVVIGYVLYTRSQSKDEAGVKLDQSDQAPYKVEVPSPAVEFPFVRPTEAVAVTVAEAVKEDPAPAAKKAPAKKVGAVAAKTAKAADKAAKKAPAKKVVAAAKKVAAKATAKAKK